LGRGFAKVGYLVQFFAQKVPKKRCFLTKIMSFSHIFYVIFKLRYIIKANKIS